ncbi:peptide ABC transporter [Serinibacter arcticus]|uniref:Peptide ABC transporter n=1 Tax=Serinibacter arcticus TaxID=1655435 RepID=A0A2U1ZVB3_9MICO|nr:ABC transporter substrate-binding protein [Serinibacter arcticus]PWD50919.1 peptide ABC transporter [Serinibacter arcticus]
MSRSTLRPPSRRATLPALLAVAALTLTACGSADAGTGGGAGSTGGSGSETTEAETDAGEPVAGGDLVWALETEPLTLNPQTNGQNKAKLLLRNLVDSYLYKNADGSYDPWLAESFTYDDAETQLTLVLREGVTFSDGDVLDSAAVLANLDQARVEGYSGQAVFSLRNVTDVATPDERTVVITLSQPDAFLLDYLSSLNGAPISPTSITTAANLAAGGTDVAGTGPFVLESYTAGQDVVLTQRADYDWAPEAADHDGPAHLDSVTYRFLGEASTRTGALTSGQVDAIDGVQSIDVPLFADSEEFTYDRALNNGLPYTYYFNVSQAPLDDVRVRQAFIKGVDLDAVLQGVHHGEVDRALAPVSSISPFYDESVGASYETDVDGANALLDEAGWTERDAEGYRTKGGARLTIVDYAAAPYLRDNRELLGQAISASLKENVGIDFQFSPVDAGTATEKADANDYQIFDNSRGDADSGQPLIFLYATDGTLARGKVDDTALDTLLTEAAATNDVATRTDLYQQAQQHIAENAYSLPIYVPQDNVAAASGVHGIAIDEAGGVLWSAYDIWKEAGA